jgi:hypothetical protein
MALAQTPPPAAKAAAPAAKTKNCMPNRDIRNSRLSPVSGYWVETNGGWWRNTGRACPLFGKDRYVRTLSIVNAQCAGDVVTVIDGTNRTIVFGDCGIGGWEKMPGPPPEDPKPQGK